MNLVKMMISPVIFCTIVLGIGSVRKAASVGRVGGLALGYFIVMSTVALAVGLVVGNLVKPGSGLEPTDALAKTGQAQASGEAKSTSEFLLGIIPDTLVSALTAGQVLQALLVALLVGFAIQSLGERGAPVLRGIEHFQRVVFKVLAMIMWAAPVGAFGAIAAVVGAAGGSALVALLKIMLGFYITCAIFVGLVLGGVLKGFTGFNVFKPAALPRPRVPADPLDVVVRDRPAPADRQDGAPGRLALGRGHHRAHRLLVQPRRHCHLPDDGVAVHRRGHGQTVVTRLADRPAGVHDHRLEGRCRGHRRRPRHPRGRPAVAPPRACSTASASSWASTAS
ncbi:hypothetical protein GCM10025868_23940 [Angustibacter aerolatus]|uniref:C4-dicarboxylate transporter DctA n=1 Tax=Angustibacter aerolatus TaxID=1162965 RepID=A0ABQ6JIH4_9ACTN|nr:hypothetical protein GCM10025868_23940 [Angustibacter aerolatus]